MPEWRDDLHADRPTIRMRLAGHADARQPGGVHPGAEHALRRGREAGRRFVLGAPGRRGGGGERSTRRTLPTRRSHRHARRRAHPARRHRRPPIARDRVRRRPARCRMSPHASDPGTGPRSAPRPPRSAWHETRAERRDRTARTPAPPHNSRRPDRRWRRRHVAATSGVAPSSPIAVNQPIRRRRPGVTSGAGGNRWEYGSRGSGPASTPYSSRMSRMVRANGPITWKSIRWPETRTGGQSARSKAAFPRGRYRRPAAACCRPCRCRSRAV